MSTITGSTASRGQPAPPAASPVAVPAAVRSRRPGWRDPRLWVGLALVAASVVVGARVLGDADRTVPVWAVRGELGAGAPVAETDLEVRRVRFATEGDADRYLSADEPVPGGATLSRDVGAGELLPRGALLTSGGAALARVTVVFQGAGAPAGLTRGDRVDVYVTSVAADDAAVAAASEGGAVAVLRAALVLDTRSSSGTLAGVGGQEVTLGVPMATDLAVVVQAAKTDHLYLVQVD